MTRERTTELASLYAAGLLDGNELREFQNLLAKNDPAVERELGCWNEVVAAATVAMTEPRKAPANLKSRVMERIALSPKTAPAKPAAGFYSILKTEGAWKTLPVPGVRVKDLAADTRRGLSVQLYELAPVSAATIAAVTAYCEYLWARYGRFPVYMPPYRTVLGFQACHLDAEFYDKFYRPEALGETQRKDFERQTR